jgi:hypothetical protein
VPLGCLLAAAARDGRSSLPELGDEAFHSPASSLERLVSLDG